MAMESSIFPVPSEVVIPPAAILSAQEGASMSFWGVVAAGTFGSWLGSATTYAVARIVGRPVIMRWGKFFFMPPHKVEKAEIFLQRYEVSGVFFARLLPVIRHLISIPAGIVRMGFGIFSLVTVLGSFAWCTVLAWYGHRIGERHPELLEYFRRSSSVPSESEEPSPYSGRAGSGRLLHTHASSDGPQQAGKSRSGHVRRKRTITLPFSHDPFQGRPGSPGAGLFPPGI